ncbi:S-layer homology domain-containing protein [Paenibacillus sp. OV219]|uniref:S-layer homology domain-containing protein n=1 Tax=Paenibacillus sp. OV219 TaxID=1884377 RepID=UPI0008B9989C|nr:S-layer homology domain-containing protein [Paenibacillus sp. OV219]SEM51775.1 Prenyltransferase and squalene oxidase repeat-containing protein [Paenibacillus sp. OV219]
MQASISEQAIRRKGIRKQLLVQLRALLLALAMLAACFVQPLAAFAEDAPSQSQLDSDSESQSQTQSQSQSQATTTDSLLQDVEAAIQSAALTVQSRTTIDDWQAVGLSKLNKPLPSSYIPALYKKLIAANGTFTLVTDYERTVIGLTAAHQDATKFAGYNLIEGIYNSPSMLNQGLNGPLYALIALDSGSYQVPTDALWTRDMLIAAIIAKQKADGGFALGNGASDPDITGMTLIALAPYAEQDAVTVAVDGAVNWLNEHQQANGGYLSYGQDASESVSQAIIGLTSNGIDPTESRFTKNGVNLIQKLLSFRQTDGSFSHTPTGSANGMATEQALQALIAYDSFAKAADRLYDFGARQAYGWPTDWILGVGNWWDREWQAIAVIRAGHEVPSTYLTAVDSFLDFMKQYPQYSLVTDYERIVMALSALHVDAADYAGMNVVEQIYNSSVMEAQGLNGPIFALLALDSGEYSTPSDAVWNRDRLLTAILAKQNADGGFALTGDVSDPDITAMALTALAPYRGQAVVETAGQKAVNWLSANQQSNGGYLSSGVDSSEGVAQAIIALASNGIDPTSTAFTKNGITLLDKLFTYLQADGGFLHVIDPQAATDFMATEQASQALSAYEMFVHDTGKLYQFGKPQPFVQVQVEGPEGPIASGRLSGTKALASLEELLQQNQIPITVTDSQYGKYVSSINFVAAGKYGGYDGWLFDVLRDGKWSFPAVGMDASDLQKSDKLVVYYGGDDTQLVDSVQVTPAVPKAGGAFRVTVKKTKLNWSDSGSEVVTSAAAGIQVKIGSVQAETDVNGVAVFSSGIQSAGTYSMEITGYQANKAPSVVRTVQSLTIAEQPVVQPPTTKYVTLSVTGDDQKGTILASKQVALQTGDTAYSVLTRELPGKVRSIGTGATLYVQGIDGLSEFDRGSGSGWMYSVNGSFPNYSAGLYKLKQNDVVAWRYTLDLGVDLGQDPGDWDPPSEGTGGSGGTGGTGGNGDNGAVKDNVIDVPSGEQQSYVVTLTHAQQDTDQFTLNIPANQQKVVLDIAAAQDGLPQVTANKGKLSLAIEKGTKLLEGGSSMELFTSLDVQDAKLNSQIQQQLQAGESLGSIEQAFVMGAADQSYRFSSPLKLTIKGGKGQLAGYIEGDVFTPIHIYESEEQGAQATNGDAKVTYAFIAGDDLIIKTNHFTSYVTYTTRDDEGTAAPEPGLSTLFKDTDQIAAWAYEAIQTAVTKGFVQGSGDKLAPKSSVTRAEFTKLMVNALDLKPTEAKSSSFKDVPKQAWFAPYVHAAYEANIITGFNDQFKPNETITREQMAVMIARALGIAPATQTTALKDIAKVSIWAQADVKTIATLQLMTGNEGFFNPSQPVTREMSFVVAMRAFDYKNKHPEEAEAGNKINRQLALTAAYVQQTVTDPIVSTLGGEWSVIGLARSGIQVPGAYYAKYYSNLEKRLKEKSGVLHNVKYTEYDRAILALTAIGRSVDNVAGYNLLERLADFDTVVKQGINGPIFALIALDSKAYSIPAAASGKTQTTRELLIEYILKRQLADGGWALGESAAEADTDVTAMALQSLAPYVQSNPAVRTAVDRAIVWLSSYQQADGGFISNKAVNLESSAQVIVALTSLAIDPDKDTRFIKNGHSALDALLSYAAPSGGFYHVKSGGIGKGGATPGEVDPMATDQALYALVAYDRYAQGQSRLYDMTDARNNL